MATSGTRNQVRNVSCDMFIITILMLKLFINTVAFRARYTVIYVLILNHIDITPNITLRLNRSLPLGLLPA